jgi:hypothetical protein
VANTLATLTADDFETLGGQSFSLTVAGRDVELKLEAVQRLGQALRAGGAFSVQFSAPAGPVLPQAIYPLRHPSLGTLELFIVPLKPEKGVNRYEAIFT